MGPQPISTAPLRSRCPARNLQEVSRAVHDEQTTVLRRLRIQIDNQLLGCRQAGEFGYSHLVRLPQHHRQIMSGISCAGTVCASYHAYEDILALPLQGKPGQQELSQLIFSQLSTPRISQLLKPGGWLS